MTTTRPETISQTPAAMPAAGGWRRPQPERFAEALQPRLMGPRLAAALGTGSPTCHVLDAKYESGVRAVVLYEHAGRLLRGDLLPDPDDAVAEPSGTAVIVSPGVRVCAFPHDPDLPGLPEVMSTTRLGGLLGEPEVVPVSGRGQDLGDRCRVSLLRYRPGKRATVLVMSRPGPTAHVAKVYHEGSKAAAVAAEARALTAATAAQGRLRFAPTVAHVPELNLVVQQRVAGTPLDALVGTRMCGPEVWKALPVAAQALAELHALPVVTQRRRPVEGELQRFVVRAGRVSSVDPRLGSSLARLAHRLTGVMAELPPAREALVHGDCKPSQFLFAGRHVYLLDLDHCGVSDQATDVGTFLASLRQLATRHALARGSRGRSGELNALADLFLRAYLDSAGDDRVRDRIRWQQAVALERKALRAFARAPRSPLADALVREADECLNDLTNVA